MECNVTTDRIDTCVTAYENFEEEKIDVDIIIPDYMPAAARVIKCEVTPVITSNGVSGEKLVTEGNCSVNVIYTDEESGALRSITENAGFTQSHQLKYVPNEYRVIDKLRTSNVNCRLQNPRRINVKATVGVAAKVIGNRPADVIISVDDCDIETKFETVDSCSFIASGDAEIKVTGEATAPDAVNEIIRSEGCAVLSDMKVLNDKVLIKGEVSVSVLYSSDQLESVQSTVPFSEVIDCSGAKDDDTAVVELSVSDIRVNLSDNTGMRIETYVRANASVYEKQQVNLLTDAYSKNGEIKTESENLTMESLAEAVTFTETVNGRLELEKNDLRIAEVCVRPDVKNVSTAGDSLMIEGDMTVGVYSSNDDEYLFFDRSVPFNVSKRIDTAGSPVRCEVGACALSVVFSVTSDGVLELKAEISFEITAFTRSSYTVISNVETDGETTGGSGSRYIIYYASAGESLWDVAKKFKTSVDSLVRDNPGFSENTEDGGMLIISAV